LFQFGFGVVDGFLFGVNLIVVFAIIFGVLLLVAQAVAGVGVEGCSANLVFPFQDVEFALEQRDGIFLC